MDCRGRKGGQADRNVFRATGFWRAVANPLAGRGHDGLSRMDVGDATFVFDANHAAQHDGDFFELWPLAGLQPSLWRDHSGDAHAGVPGIHLSRELFDTFGFIAGSSDDGRARNQSRHRLNIVLAPSLGPPTSARR